MPLIRLFVTLLLLTVVTSASAQPSSNLGWSELANRRGATVDFPGGLFTQEVAHDSSRLSFSTSEGTSRFDLFSLENSRRESPTQFAKRADNGRERLTYKRITNHFIAASTIKDGRILYRRCNFSRGMIHCVDIRYPTAEKRAWDGIVTRISLSLRPR